MAAHGRLGISAELWPAVAAAPWQRISNHQAAVGPRDVYLKCHFAEAAYAFLVTDLQHVWSNESGPTAIERLMEEICPQLDSAETLCFMLKKDLESQVQHGPPMAVELASPAPTSQGGPPVGPRDVLRALTEVLAAEDEGAATRETLERQLAQQLAVPCLSLAEVGAGPPAPGGPLPPGDLILRLDTELEVGGGTAVALPFQWKVVCRPVAGVHQVLLDLMVNPLAGLVSALWAQADQLKQLLLAKDKELKLLRAREGDIFLPGDFEAQFLQSPQLTASFEKSSPAFAHNPRLAALYSQYMEQRLGPRHAPTALPSAPQPEAGMQTPWVVPSGGTRDTSAGSREGSGDSGRVWGGLPPGLPPEQRPSEVESTEQERQKRRRERIEEELLQKKQRKEAKEKSTSKKIAKALL
uniref:Non-homologous end-joining factor 1 n=1 Tax=Eutreptiella gymnastica TaxID=73025 RepID=A0A7S1IXD5_9EUGL